jgi:hypothetical protein
MSDMSTETRTAPAPYDDRFGEALAWLAVRYEERGDFLSDDDIVTAAELFSTSAEKTEADYRRLVEDLFIACTEENDR